MSKARKASATNTKKLSIKQVLSIFMCFFVIFAFVGYRRADSLKTDPRYIPAFLADKITVERDRNGIYLVYHCPDLSKSYHVDADRSFGESSIDPQSDYNLLHSIAPIINDDRLIDVVVGGASAWTVKDMFEYITGAGSIYERQSRIAKTAAAIFGAISGYNLGYYISIHNPPACDGPEVKESLNDSDHAVWHTLVHMMWSKAYRGIEEPQTHLASCITVQFFMENGLQGTAPGDMTPKVQQIELQVQQIKLREQEIELQINQIKDRVSEEQYIFKTKDFDDINQAITDLHSLDKQWC